MSNINERDIRKAELFLEAEKLEKQFRYQEESPRWLKVKCVHCGYEVKYAPKEDFKGDLRCPNCGEVFHVSRLDDWVQ